MEGTGENNSKVYPFSQLAGKRTIQFYKGSLRYLMSIVVWLLLGHLFNHFLYDHRINVAFGPKKSIRHSIWIDLYSSNIVWKLYAQWIKYIYIAVSLININTHSWYHCFIFSDIDITIFCDRNVLFVLTIYDKQYDISASPIFLCGVFLDNS